MFAVARDRLEGGASGARSARPRRRDEHRGRHGAHPITPARMLAATTCHVRASAAGGPAGVALGSAHFNAWRQAAADSYSSDGPRARPARVGARGARRRPRRRRDAAASARAASAPRPSPSKRPRCGASSWIRAPERSAAVRAPRPQRSPLLLPPLPSSDRSDLGAPYAPWPEADALDGPAPDETDSPIEDDSTAGEMLLDAITGAARAVEAEHSLLEWRRRRRRRRAVWFGPGQSRAPARARGRSPRRDARPAVRLRRRRRQRRHRDRHARLRRRGRAARPRRHRCTGARSTR